ncbi:alpha/beta fold hydrolase [Chloroflexota bacterium]
MRRAFFDTPDGQIHYYTHGVGEPSLVLLHQTPRSSDEFNEMMQILGQKRRTIAVDIIGYGDSDKTTEFYGAEDYAKTIIKLLDSLGVMKATMVGHHSGTKIAIELATAFPERLEDLVLIGPYFWNEDVRQRAIAQVDRYDKYKIKADGSHLMEMWNSYWVKEAPDPEIKNRMVLDILKAGETLHRGHFASAAYRQEERLPLIQCPTLIIWGTRDIDWHVEIGLNIHNFAESIPNCTVAKVQDGAVSLTNEKPEEVSRLMLEFLGS